MRAPSFDTSPSPSEPAAAATASPMPSDALELQALLDATVDAVIVIDHHGAMQRFNHAAERLFGYAASETLGRNVSMLMTGPDRVHHDGYLQRYNRTGVGHIIGIGREVQARRKDGSSFPGLLSVGRIGNSDPPRFVGFLHDVTVRQQALAGLERERDRANRYLEAAQTILVSVDATHRITLINRKGCEILGQDEQLLLGKDWFQTLVAPAYRESSARDFDALIERHSTVPLFCEYPVLTGTAAERLIAWRCVVVRDADGHFTSVLCSGDDITESRRTDQEMRETQERMMHVARLATLGELASGISHELNQPLAAIATYAQAARRLVAMPEADPADVREALQEIADQALRAGEIIRRVRALARRQVGSREPCDLNEVVTDLLPLIQAEARASDVRVQLQLPAGLPQVNVDRIQIQQVLLNLVRNAIEALQANAVGERAVTLRTCSTPSGEVQLAVTDNGPGFTEQMRGQIFVPFITSKDNGTGLGLAISRSIVESHRGRLEYQPAEPHGASLLLTLPAS